ncbi:MAG: formyltetrahydrofolate deformylase, partial [Hyphomonadaceae bacterium]
MRDFILTLSCPDRIGVVAAVSGFLAGQSCNILESAQFGDRATGEFFMRVVFQAPDDASLAGLEAAFAPAAQAFAMACAFHDAAAKTPTLIMVSRHGHCLNDLMFRWRFGDLPIDLRAVVSNHEDFRGLVEQAGLPFHYLPVAAETKAAQERALLEIVAKAGVELVVLARYMQVLSAETCARLRGRVINIHHSFLPGFKGARPYHRAHARGVKLIGATAHYVSEDLDEGPIIEQATERVHHGQSVQ